MANQESYECEHPDCNAYTMGYDNGGWFDDHGRWYCSEHSGKS